MSIITSNCSVLSLYPNSVLWPISHLEQPLQIKPLENGKSIDPAVKTYDIVVANLKRFILPRSYGPGLPRKDSLDKLKFYIGNKSAIQVWTQSDTKANSLIMYNEDKVIEIDNLDNSIITWREMTIRIYKAWVKCAPSTQKHDSRNRLCHLTIVDALRKKIYTTSLSAFNKLKQKIANRNEFELTHYENSELMENAIEDMVFYYSKVVPKHTLPDQILELSKEIKSKVASRLLPDKPYDDKREKQNLSLENSFRELYERIDNAIEEFHERDEILRSMNLSLRFTFRQDSYEDSQQQSNYSCVIL